MARNDWICKACNRGKHGLLSCHAYKMLGVEARWKVVKQAGLCFQCLGPHLVRNCHSTQCPMCGATHHSSLHSHDVRVSRIPAQNTPSAGAAVYSPFRSAPGAASVGLERSADIGPRRCNSLQTQGERCYVQTALVVVEGPEGSCPARVLIDGGSDSSFIRASLAEKLGLPTVKQGRFECVGFQEKMEEASIHDEVSVKLRSRYSDELLASINFPLLYDMFNWSLI